MYHRVELRAAGESMPAAGGPAPASGGEPVDGPGAHRASAGEAILMPAVTPVDEREVPEEYV
jgi:hypothetical protein